MKKIRVVHLLDDLSFGGVMKGMAVFQAGPIAALAEHELVKIDPRARLAPRVDADLIVTHLPPNWRRLSMFASLKLRNPRARVIHVEHSYTRCFEALRVPDRQRFRAMLALALRCVDARVCVSAAQADWLAEAASLDRAAIRVIHPYCDHPGLADLPLPGPVDGRPLRIAAYGRYAPEKGFDRLIRAARHGAFDGAELVLAGAGPEGERLTALAADLPNVRVGGRINDIAGFLADADLVVVPSRYEAYGQVANEAREAGRPILVAPTDGLVEQVGEAGLVIDFDDPAAIRRAFATMTPARRLAMGAAGRAAVRDAGTVRRQQWAELVLDVMGATESRGVRSSSPIATSAGQMR